MCNLSPAFPSINTFFFYGRSLKELKSCPINVENLHGFVIGGLKSRLIKAKGEKTHSMRAARSKREFTAIKKTAAAAAAARRDVGK